jgi:hypothetical protein
MIELQDGGSWEIRIHLGSFDARDHPDVANERMADITSEISDGP